MLRAVTLVLTASFVMGFTTHSEAGVLYDTLVDTTYRPDATELILGGGRNAGPTSISDAFVPLATENLDSILIALSYPTDGADDGLFKLMMTDASHNVLESWTGLTASHTFDGTPVSVVTIPSVLHPQLHNGETYLLVVSPGASSTNAGWELVPGDVRHQYRVLGTPLVSTPEPGTLALAGLGALGLVTRALRRRKP